MKIIALLPFKNEAWVLPSYISSVSKIADEIIALDDNSTDGGDLILKNAGARVISFNSKDEEVVNMSVRRQKLLDEGRMAGGTHFIWLDADEVFSSNFTTTAKGEILKLKPGEKMSLRWVQAWKDFDKYLDDKRSPLGYIWKDFIFCDDKISRFSDKFLSESRTPENSSSSIHELPEDRGVVIHWAYANWNAVQYKQAWYRCTELIKGARSAFRINVTYSITLDEPHFTVTAIPSEWLETLIAPEKTRVPTHLNSIKNYFAVHGVQFFEKLDIWHITELEKFFIQETGRKPIPDRPSRLFLEVNKIKNIVRSYIIKYI